jgi:hypothetical protein
MSDGRVETTATKAPDVTTVTGPTATTNRMRVDRTPTVDR